MVWHTKISAEGRVTEGRVTDSAGLTDAATTSRTPTGE
jgi:hypothetical protein